MPDPVECSVFLGEVRADSEATTSKVRSLFGDLSAEQITWRPPEGGWGIAECLEHLTITDAGYLDKLDRVLAKRSKVDSPPPFKGGKWAAKFIGMLEPGAKRKLKAPGKFKSQAEDPPADALERFLATQERLQAVCEKLEGYDLTRNKVASPISGLIRFRLGDAMRLMVVHDARHVAQAERVMGHDAFPAS